MHYKRCDRNRMFCGMFETRRRQDLSVVFTAVHFKCVGDAEPAILSYSGFRERQPFSCIITEAFFNPAHQGPLSVSQSPFVGIDGIIKH